ncbi:MAG: sulfurtransferase TusA family protein [Gammaproteobacteria bacterium]
MRAGRDVLRQIVYNKRMEEEFDREIDLSGLRCPLPVLRVKKALGEMRPGGVLRAFATDPGAAEDIPAFLKQSGNTLRETASAPGGRFFIIVKR